MPHGQLVVGPEGWSGWAIHVSTIPHPVGTALDGWRSRLFAPVRSPERESFDLAFPLESPATVTDYWERLVSHVPEGTSRAPRHSWMREAAMETIRQTTYPQYPP